jgi:non-ribosomal peptide synthetase component E (peptide arylation enzyme)
MIDAYIQKGYWTRELTVDFWEKNAVQYPTEEAIVDAKFRVTWAEAATIIDRLVAVFLDRGLKKDDVLLCQLYNSVPLTLVRLACEKAGILVALVPSTFRETEIAAVLGQTHAVAAVFPARFRRFDYAAMFSQMQRRFDQLKHLFVVGEEMLPGGTSLYEIMNAGPGPDHSEGQLDRQKFDPFEFTEIVTTSGSTDLPKCVRWTACARLCTAREYVQLFHLTHQDVIAAFSSSISGSAETLIHRTAPQLGAKTVMVEHFTPVKACEVIDKERVTAAAAVPTLLARLLDFAGLGDYCLDSLRCILVSGGPLSYQVGLQAEECLGCKILQGYGGMDCGGVSAGDLDVSREVRLTSVGRPLKGNVVVLVDPETGVAVPHGEVGVVTVEGPHCVGGYFRDTEATCASAIQGRFDMGDLGAFDEEGNVFLRGRIKDIIIRGGQTIYPKEIEEILAQHPKVSEAALVRLSDVEMGEQACAFVVPKPGQTLTFEEMVSFFRARKVAPYKIPERLGLVAELPLVPAGNKVDKRQLEELLHQLMD